MAALLDRHGFTVQRDQDLIEVADALGFSGRTRGPVANSRCATAVRR